jgi:hypothetical protein
MGGRSSPRVLLVVAALVVAAAAALGISELTRSHANQSSQVRRVVKTYEVALMSGDGRTACAQLTPPMSRRLGEAAAGVHIGSSCQDVARATHAGVAALMAHAPSSPQAARMRRNLEDPPVEVLSVHGDRATARVAGVSITQHPIRLVRREGRWKIAGLSMYLVGSSAKSS